MRHAGDGGYQEGKRLPGIVRAPIPGARDTVLLDRVNARVHRYALMGLQRHAGRALSSREARATRVDSRQPRAGNTAAACTDANTLCLDAKSGRSAAPAAGAATHGGLGGASSLNANQHQGAVSGHRDRIAACMSALEGSPDDEPTWRYLESLPKLVQESVSLVLHRGVSAESGSRALLNFFLWFLATNEPRTIETISYQSSARRVAFRTE